MRRTVIVDRDSDYSNQEIQMIQANLKAMKLNIIVFRDFDSTTTCLLCVNSDITYSFTKLLEIVGKAYIGE
jgi:ABC-type branched-subunit amino acid transport system substrate-binding protein